MYAACSEAGLGEVSVTLPVLKSLRKRVEGYSAARQASLFYNTLVHISLKAIHKALRTAETSGCC